MNCHGMRRLLSAYADEEVTADERQAIALHLSVCADCRRICADLRELRAALLGMEPAPVPLEFSAGWRAAIRRERPAAGTDVPWRAWIGRLRWAIPAAACLLLALGLAARLTGEIRRPNHGADRQRLLSLAPESEPAEKAVSRNEPGRQAEKSPAVERPASSAEDQEQEPESPGPGTEGARAAAESSSAATRFASTEAPVAPRAGLTASPFGADSASGSDRAVPEGSWRVWLTSVGARRAALARALVDAGVLPPAAEQAALDVPMLLREGLSYAAAQEIAQAVEEAGGHATVELMSR